jgi:hypothetical protein
MGGIHGGAENVMPADGISRCRTTTIPPPSFSNHRRSGIHDAPII